MTRKQSYNTNGSDHTFVISLVGHKRNRSHNTGEARAVVLVSEGGPCLGNRTLTYFETESKSGTDAATVLGRGRGVRCRGGRECFTELSGGCSQPFSRV
eukprot:1544078-Pyramimonas_sp.AAC.1